MRANRNFLNYNKLVSGKKTRLFLYKNRASTYYQANGLGFTCLASKGYTIEEPFFNQFLKTAKKFKRLSMFQKCKSLNFNKTSKPNGIRMGKGKGKIKHKLGMVKKNQSLLLLNQIDERSLEILFKTLKGKVSYKLGFTYQRNSF